MSTLRDAAALLARATTVARSEPLVRALGFAGWLPLPADARAAAGIDGVVTDTRIAVGPGQLRALGGRAAPADALGANIDEIHHQRTFSALPVQSVEVEFVVRTRSPQHIHEVVTHLTSEGFPARQV